MKTILLTLILIALSTPQICEAHIELGVQYQPQRTWNISPEYDDLYEYVKTTGEAYGLSFLFGGKTKFILESGVIFSNQGQKFTEVRTYYNSSSYDSTTLNVHFDLRYIKIPVLPGISGNRNNKVFGSVNFGLQFSFINSATLIVEDTENSPYNYNETTDFKDTYKGLTIDIAFRAGINVHATNKILLSALFSLDQSLSDVDKVDPGYIYSSSINRTVGGLFRVAFMI